MAAVMLRQMRGTTFASRRGTLSLHSTAWSAHAFPGSHAQCLSRSFSLYSITPIHKLKVMNLTNFEVPHQQVTFKSSFKLLAGDKFSAIASTAAQPLLRNSYLEQRRHQSSSSINSSSSRTMSGFSKQTVAAGDGTTFPRNGQTVIMEYTGWLYDPAAPNNRGKQFDSSVGRGDFQTPIGVGRVIKGWDEGVPQMSLNEHAVLTIPGHMAYGERGFPGLIPPNATLIFEVKLKGIR